MKYIKSFLEKKIPITSSEVRKILPQTISILTSNGEFELEISDMQMSYPKLWVSYFHSTPEKTGNALTDGEPDYIGFDLNFIKKDRIFEINVENTYGDAMMFEFKLVPPNEVIIGHYNGIKSKFDPEYKFSYTEKSIQDLIDFFNRFTFGFNLTRDKFNFLDSNDNSYLHK